MTKSHFRIVTLGEQVEALGVLAAKPHRLDGSTVHAAVTYLLDADGNEIGYTAWRRGPSGRFQTSAYALRAGPAEEGHERATIWL